jgi:SAM-dependent methyltransferase
VTALARWREELERWAIPAEIIAAAPESPYGFPTALFRTRGERARLGSDPTPTTVRALERLPEGGRVLDVGCGGGATSLPLAGRAGVLVGVDAQEDMLEGFVSNARAAGVEAEGITGRWPDVAGRVGSADLAVAGHVLYNVADLEPFARRLADVAGGRVVFELTERHPLHWMNGLWLRFHGLERPDGPTADDAVEALTEMGLDPSIEHWTASPTPGVFDRKDDAVALIRRRLCLPTERDGELTDALGPRLVQRGGRWSAGPTEQRLATIRLGARARAGSS